MADKAEDTVEKPTVEEAEKEVEVVAEPVKEKTVAEIAEEAAPAPKKPETVGLDKFLSEKEGRKAAEKALKDLQDKVTAGTITETEVSADIAAIGKKYDVNADFLKELVDAVETKTEKKFADRLTPLEEEKRQQKIDAAFTKAFESAMVDMPEFTKVVNKDVIKTLSLDPNNKNKTFSQIIEETYGGAVPGKRTVEPTKPGGGKEPEALNIDRARKDPAYFDEVMGNPKLKKEYNDAMLKRGF